MTRPDSGEGAALHERRKVPLATPTDLKPETARGVLREARVAIECGAAKRPAAGDVRMKRAYERPANGDGLRILVDRLWPRGLKKADAAIDFWEKELAPSTELRQWFGHMPERWSEFRRRYVIELRQHAERVGQLRELARKTPLTLVYAAHDEAHNDAVVLREVLLGRVGR